MIIYSIVRTVQPGTMTSSLVGDTEVEFYRTRERAEEFVGRCRACVAITGITFRVDEVDDESPDRVPDGFTRNPPKPIPWES